MIFTGNTSLRERLFLYDQLGRERSPPPATLPWVRGVLFIDLGGEGGAAMPAAFDAMRTSVAGTSVPDAAVRCVVPTGVGLEARRSASTVQQPE